jgi:hypothetical protein
MSDRDSIGVIQKCGMPFVGEGMPERHIKTTRDVVSRAEFGSISE